MFDKIFNWAAKQLYNKMLRESERNKAETDKFSQDYFDTTHENITAIITNALSVLAFGDSSVTVTDEKGSTTKRTELLNSISQKEFSKAKLKVSAALGTGMICSIPYCTNNGLGNRIYIDTITKERFLITSMQGDDITGITAMADIIYIDNNKYIRWTDYEVNNGKYTIRNKATNSSGEIIPLSSVKEWENIQPEMTINGVDRLPVAFYKCPTGNRRPDRIDGVPITYGCNSTLLKIKNTLSEIEDEYKNKRALIFADNSLFMPVYDEYGNIIKYELNSKMFIRTSNNDEKNTITIFDPPIRDSAYYNKLLHHFEMLEKEIGCSKGILTDMVTNGATATEIKRSNNATFNLTDAIRMEYQHYFDDLIYAVNVLCNTYNLTPISGYAINYDWNYSLLEDSENTFNQLSELESRGLISPEKLNMWVTDQTEEQAKKEIEQARQSNIVNSVFEE